MISKILNYNYRNGAFSSGNFGDGNLSVDIDGTANIQRKLLAEFAIDVKNDTLAVHSKVNLVPFFIKDLWVL